MDLMSIEPPRRSSNWPFPVSSPSIPVQSDIPLSEYLSLDKARYSTQSLSDEEIKSLPDALF